MIDRNSWLDLWESWDIQEGEHLRNAGIPMALGLLLATHGEVECSEGVFLQEQQQFQIQKGALFLGLLAIQATAHTDTDEENVPQQEVKIKKVIWS